MKNIFFLLFLFCNVYTHAQEIFNTDVLVIGGGTGGTAAAIQSARSGAKTILVESTGFLGGMLTAAGVSCTDGNDLLPSGMWTEFRQALYSHYGTTNLATGWVSETCFEPHVADSIFKSWAAKEISLTTWFHWQFEQVLMEGKKVTGAVFKNDLGRTFTIHAKITVDATELGDVFAKAGVDYAIGTDDKNVSKENIAPGKTSIIQDIAWAATLKDYGAGTDHTIPKPKSYREEEYYCSCTTAPCTTGKPYATDAQGMLNYGKLPGNKYMINWPAHGNDSYLNVIENSIAERNRKYLEAKTHTLGFIYFIQTTLGYKNLGLADDELDSGLAVIPYNREGRRMRGVVQMNVNHILHPYDQPERLYRTGIAVGDYPVDHHHGQNPKTPKINFPRIPSFNIPLGSLIPAQINGLIVCDKGISVTNIVNGATRLQPVVLLTGQAAGMLAAACIADKTEPRNIGIRNFQQNLLRAGCSLMPYVDVKPDNFYWESIQRIGLTGILRGTGKPEGWENKTFFYPDSTISVHEFENGLADFYQGILKNAGESILTIQKTLDILISIQKRINMLASKTPGRIFLNADVWGSLHLQNFDLHRPVKRFELAVLVDHFYSPFQHRISLNGFVEKSPGK